jgi:hypothetical protein
MTEDSLSGTLATVSCAECGRSPRREELWRIYFADIGEAVIYCPHCAEREFEKGSDQGERVGKNPRDHHSR